MISHKALGLNGQGWKLISGHNKPFETEIADAKCQRGHFSCPTGLRDTRGRTLHLGG